MDLKGDVIALYMPQFIETYVAYFAILKIGVVLLYSSIWIKKQLLKDSI